MKSEADVFGGIFLAVFGLLIVTFFIMLLSLGGDDAAERDEERRALEEEIPVVEKDLLENVDVDEAERYEYKLLDGESYEAEKAVAEKYGFECFFDGSSLTKTGEAGESPYAIYECRKKPGFWEKLFS